MEFSTDQYPAHNEAWISKVLSLTANGCSFRNLWMSQTGLPSNILSQEFPIKSEIYGRLRCVNCIKALCSNTEFVTLSCTLYLRFVVDQTGILLSDIKDEELIKSWCKFIIHTFLMHLRTNLINKYIDYIFLLWYWKNLQIQQK